MYSMNIVNVPLVRSSAFVVTWGFFWVKFLRNSSCKLFFPLVHWMHVMYKLALFLIFLRKKSSTKEEEGRACLVD